MPVAARVDPALVGTWDETIPYWRCYAKWTLAASGHYVRDLSALPTPRTETGTWAILDGALLHLADGEDGTHAVALDANHRTWRGAESESAVRK